MSEQLTGTSVYVGDIHGTRLRGLEQALAALQVEPDALLCTMDLDQVLAIQELAELERRYRDAGRPALLVPGNHEAALLFRIGIDSATYRPAQQNINILALIEAIHLPDFLHLRRFVEDKLEIRGGLRICAGAGGQWPGLLIHGALAGKQERYIHEFPPELQEHVRTRSDLWLRLESHQHLQANFAAMREHGVELMLRGHDHYAAMRSEDAAGQVCSHQIVINEIGGEAIDYDTEAPRSGDSADDLALVDPDRFTRARDEGALYWHEIEPDRRHVINFGPYYQGYFGLLRAAAGDEAPAAAFCRTSVSFYTAEDRRRLLRPFSLAHQARAGKSYYELFRR